MDVAEIQAIHWDAEWPSSGGLSDDLHFMRISLLGYSNSEIRKTAPSLLGQPERSTWIHRLSD